MPVVERVTHIAAPLDRVFVCALRPDLPPVLACGGRLIDVKPGARASDPSPVGDRVRAGDVKTFETRVLWVRRRAVMRVTEIEPNRWIREHCTAGPLRVFQHERFFEPVAGGTRVLDVVAFRAPFGPIGRLLERTPLFGRVERWLGHQIEALRTAAEAYPRGG